MSMTGSADELQARKAALEDLTRLRGSVEEARQRLRSFGWDSAPNLVTLSPATVIDVLGRYLSGDLTAEQIEQWADAIEVRVDIAFPPLFETVMKELFFELAHPEIERPLSPDTTHEWTERLRDSPAQ
jgi:hypothetical protein